jgi:hypothetical protein
VLPASRAAKNELAKQFTHRDRIMVKIDLCTLCFESLVSFFG